MLPFANLSNDPAQDYFVDGVTRESLTTDFLSRLRGSFVIARNTAFTFKGKNVDAREIGKELGVPLHVLVKALCSARRGACGSMSNSSTRRPAITFGLTALISLPPDLFEMQGMRSLPACANQLGAGADRPPRRDARSKRRTPIRWIFIFRDSGMAGNRGINPENMAQARGYFERAVERSIPTISDALLRCPGGSDYSVGRSPPVQMILTRASAAGGGGRRDRQGAFSTAE